MQPKHRINIKARNNVTRSSDRNAGSQISQVATRKNHPEESLGRPASTDVATQATAYVGMKLIPWGDVWKSLRTARFRGNGEMIEVFYDTLFKEAVFDDRGAWSLERRQLH
jgi:hypothetical protein